MKNYGIWRSRASFLKKDFPNLKNHEIISECLRGLTLITEEFESEDECMRVFRERYAKTLQIVYPNDISVTVYNVWEIDNLGKPVAHLGSSYNYDDLNIETVIV